MVAGKWGMEPEDGDGGRYRLSFTVGGLLAQQGRAVARLAVADLDAHGDAPDHGEVGERVVRIRREAIDANVLAVRTQAANTRVVAEVLRRLSALTAAELRHLAAPGTPMADRQALMWVAMCRYYAFVGRFATEVLRDHYLLGVATITRGDYDRFVLDQAMWHPELNGLSPATASKLRSNLFKAMAEAELVERGDGTLLPSLLGRAVTAILDDRPESFLFFPMAGR